ncbi:FCS-Like Zinc finger 17-like [Aristolochia californica]|uniref:FCS-Like Zinc finger 17-like n=1 Tax=Aristolochia californica TaxID=171875 RepID=UPI0035D9A1A3
MEGAPFPVKFTIGSEEEDTKEAPTRLAMEIGTTYDAVGLRILIVRKPGKALSAINKVTLRGSVSAMSPRIRPAVPQMGFLEACRLCKKKLSPEKNVYMYRGDQAFCSVNCRCEQILLDEMSEREDLMLRRRKRQESCNAGNHAQESHRLIGTWDTG